MGNEGSQIGCNQSAATTDVPCGNAGGVHGAYSSQPCCDTLMEPTLNDPKLLSYDARTWPNGTTVVSKAHNPWRAPGHSPIASPCGIAAGAPSAHSQNGGIPP